MLSKKRNNHRGTCITIRVSSVTQKLKVYLANEECILAVFSTDLGHIFGGDVRNDLGILRRGKGSHEPTFAHDIVRIHSLMIYTDIVEYNIVEETDAPFLRCFPFISKFKSDDIITFGQYLNSQTFGNLQFRRLLKNSLHSIHIDLRDTSGEKIPFVSLGITPLVPIFKKISVNNFPTTKLLDVKEGVVLELLCKLFGEPPFLSRENISFQQQNAWVLICWSLQCQR